MFANLKQIFNSKNRDLLKRILFTLAALFVFKIGTTIIPPPPPKNPFIKPTNTPPIMHHKTFNLPLFSFINLVLRFF